MPSSNNAPGATCRSVVARRSGSPAVLQVVAQPLRAPVQGAARIRVQAAAVSRPDISVRAGTALYSGTPLGRRTPFVPGYAIIGVVDALGPGVLTVTGGYTEGLYWRSDRLIRVPPAVDAGEAVTLILNYLVTSRRSLTTPTSLTTLLPSHQLSVSGACISDPTFFGRCRSTLNAMGRPGEPSLPPIHAATTGGATHGTI